LLADDWGGIELERCSAWEGGGGISSKETKYLRGVWEKGELVVPDVICP